jgi:hypothetical protein
LLAFIPAVRAWLIRDGSIGLQLLETVTGVRLARGIAMLLDLPQPRIAMTTVFGRAALRGGGQTPHGWTRLSRGICGCMLPARRCRRTRRAFELRNVSCVSL